MKKQKGNEDTVDLLFSFVHLSDYNAFYAFEKIIVLGVHYLTFTFLLIDSQSVSFVQYW